MNVKPLVSISCNTYNHAGYIADAIEGFLRQKTDFPIEILIHDDASTDGTADIIRRYQALYPSLIKPVFQQENQYSRNVRIGRFNLERAQGKYVALCEGDDYWTDPLKLQTQVEFMEENKSYAMCSTDFNRVNEGGKILQYGALKEVLKTDLTQREILDWRLPKYMTILFRRAALDVRLFSDANVRIGDIFLVAIVTRHGPVKYLDFISGCYRVHSGGVWSSKSHVDRNIEKIKSLIAMRKVLNRDEETKAIEKKIGETMLNMGKLSVKWNSWAGMKTVFTRFSLIPYMGHFLAGARLQYIELRQQAVSRKARNAGIRRKKLRTKIRGIARRIWKWMPGFILNKLRKP